MYWSLFPIYATTSTKSACGPNCNVESIPSPYPLGPPYPASERPHACLSACSIRLRGSSGICRGRCRRCLRLGFAGGRSALEGERRVGRSLLLEAVVFASERWRTTVDGDWRKDGRSVWADIPSHSYGPRFELGSPSNEERLIYLHN